MKYDKRHRGPYDRGQADYWYGRGCEPHYYSSGNERVTDLTEVETFAYMAGYEDAMRDGVQKDWE